MEPTKRTVKCRCGSYEYTPTENKHKDPIWLCVACGKESHRQVRSRKAKVKKSAKEKLFKDDNDNRNENYFKQSFQSKEEQRKILSSANNIYGYVESPNSSFRVLLTKEDAKEIIENSTEKDFYLEEIADRDYIFESYFNTIVE